MKANSLEKMLAIGAVILVAVLLRLTPHAPNVAPIAALALFSGVMISSRVGFLIPLIAMLISDYFLGFHSTIPYVYGSFLLIACIGYLLKNKRTVVNVSLGSLIGSTLFFFITNFGVWASSSMYEKSLSGLMLCYSMGLPFFRNTLLGDLFYTTVFFVGYRIFSLLFVLMLPARRKTARYIGNTV